MAKQFQKSQTNYKGYETCSPAIPPVKFSKTTVKDVSLTHKAGPEIKTKDSRKQPKMTNKNRAISNPAKMNDS